MRRDNHTGSSVADCVRFALLILLTLTVTVGCTNPTEDRTPMVQVQPPTTIDTLGTFDDRAGESGSITIGMGKPVPLSSIDDLGADACKLNLDSVGGTARAVAVPLTISVLVGATSTRKMTFGIEPFGLDSTGGVTNPSQQSFRIVQYRGTAPICRRPEQAYASSPLETTPATSHVQRSYLIVPGARSADMSSHQSATGSIVLQPFITFGGTSIGFSLDRSGPAVVSCLEPDHAAGKCQYVSLDPVQALLTRCTATGRQSAKEPTNAEKICQAAYPQTKSYQSGKYMKYDRSASLLEVCSGAIGAAGLTMTAPIECAVIAAAAAEAGGGRSDKAGCPPMRRR